ncbi:MAG: glycosyltransferase [Planctomycetes bacterium]|nr:glycosyltransferase [Planctomycetota bacterium]
MTKILFLVANLNYGGLAKQLTLTARGLPHDRFQVRVVVLGQDGPLSQPLRAAGLEPDCLGWSRRLNIAPLRRWRQLVKNFQPDVIHAWGWPAFRTDALLTGRTRGQPVLPEPPRLVANLSLTSHPQGTGWHWLDRWLLKQVDRVVTAPPFEVGSWQRLGVGAEKIRVIAAGVDLASSAGAETNGQPSPGDRPLPPATLNLPSNTHFLACVGPLEAAKGFRNALWAFDILRCLYKELHLLVIGEGPDRSRLEEFAQAIGVARQVHFVGPQADVAALLARAEVVLVPSQANRGVNAVLEAMAAGRPVVASRCPALAEVVVDEETGLLTPPGDQAAFARQIRRLLDQPDLGRRLGEAGRARAAAHFAAHDQVAHYLRLYDELPRPT